jgi:uncharacterized protein
MIVTLVTGGLCGLLYFWLSVRVVQVRQTLQVAIGDGGDGLLLQRIRAHANFAEYVPICLVLLGAIEISSITVPPGLWVAGLALVAVRIAHMIGMGRAAPNPYRIVGAGGTWAIMVGLSLWSLYVALTLMN